MDKPARDLYKTRMLGGTSFIENLHYVPEAGWTRSAYSVTRAGKVAAGPDYAVERVSHTGQDILYCLCGAGVVENSWTAAVRAAGATRLDRQRGAPRPYRRPADALDPAMVPSRRTEPGSAAPKALPRWRAARHADRGRCLDILVRPAVFSRAWPRTRPRSAPQSPCRRVPHDRRPGCRGILGAQHAQRARRNCRGDADGFEPTVERRGTMRIDEPQPLANPAAVSQAFAREPSPMAAAGTSHICAIPHHRERCAACRGRRSVRILRRLSLQSGIQACGRNFACRLASRRIGGGPSLTPLGRTRCDREHAPVDAHNCCVNSIVIASEAKQSCVREDVLSAGCESPPHGAIPCEAESNCVVNCRAGGVCASAAGDGVGSNRRRMRSP